MSGIAATVTDVDKEDDDAEEDADDSITKESVSPLLSPNLLSFSGTSLTGLSGSCLGLLGMFKNFLLYSKAIANIDIVLYPGLRYLNRRIEVTVGSETLEAGA